MKKHTPVSAVHTEPAVPVQSTRRGFLFGLTAGAGAAGAAVMATSVKAGALSGGVAVDAAKPAVTGLSEHARKYYRSTTI